MEEDTLKQVVCFFNRSDVPMKTIKLDTAKISSPVTGTITANNP